MSNVKGKMRKKLEITAAMKLQFDIRVRIPANEMEDESEELHRRGEYIVTYNNGTQAFLDEGELEREWVDL